MPEHAVVAQWRQDCQAGAVAPPPGSNRPDALAALYEAWTETATAGDLLVGVADGNTPLLQQDAVMKQVLEAQQAGAAALQRDEQFMGSNSGSQ